MDIRQLVQDIAREIMSLSDKPNLQRKAPKLLFIFCDSRAHEGHSDQFILLDNHGIEYDLVFLDGVTSAWIGMSRMESSGAGKTIAIDEYAPAPIELPKDYDGVVIPEIDLDNASRIAAGLKGSVKAEIVFSALLLNKPVWVGKDSPGVKRNDRKTLKVLSLSPGYTKLFQKRLAELEELGIMFGPGQELSREVVRYFELLKSDGVGYEADGSSAAATASRTATTRPDVALITADWVSAQAASLNGLLEVERGTIVSPLAKDLLRDKGIVLHFSDKG
ncbi:hypothetical protein [Paenibacillus herberti]|uniref:Uncharacterized protein n=1 Tax=Paenibacillus herberti TaxID=1619309 RepID=A0A229NVB0_9BACL|nr:hypothetical protein [Paenibacillus herberti]OXM13822.1 hypothetical protein CGZ75_20560 [Paenibacillus herberti]